MTQFCWDRAKKLAASVTLKRRPEVMEVRCPSPR